MSTENILGIIGLVVTLILGYLRLKYTSLNRRTTEIIFLKNTSISLFKTIVKNLDDIEIRFKGNKINENLILFKATFFNIGNVDIQKSVVHKPLEIELPINYNWVSHKLIDMSEGLGLTTQVNANKLIFEWDLLKEGEHFTFDSLIEYKSSKNEEANTDIEKKLVNNLTISHRITDLKKINKENSIPRPTHLSSLFFMTLVILGFVFALFYVSFGQFLFPTYQVLHEVKLDSIGQYASLTADKKNTIIIKDDKGDEIAILEKNEIQGRLGGQIKIVKDPINYFSLIFSGLLSIIYFIVWISLMINKVRARRLYSRLKSVADKYDDLEFKNRGSGSKLFEFILR